VGLIVAITWDPVLQVTWRAALEAQRHTVLPATTCAAGARRLHEGGVDLVLADYDVAGGIGHLIKALDRLPDPPPFVLVSAAPDAPMLSARLGAAAFLTKPCLVAELLDAVQRVLGDVPRGLEERPTAPVARRLI
jgi:DNA-binding response OmpR family regulator